MRRTLAKNVDRLLQALVDRFHADPRVRNERLTLALVSSFLSEQRVVSGLNDPFHHARFCYDLFAPLPVQVERIKWSPPGDDQDTLRFRRLCDQLTDGLPSYGAQLAREVLLVANTFAGGRDEMPEYGYDVSRHFLISSSFALKGKLLFNGIRFMRPVNCVEIGTAWGMSAYFMLQALEQYSLKGRLWTVEADELQYQTSVAMLDERFGARVRCVHGFSQDRLPEVVAEFDRLDFYFHDGGHEFDNIVSNFEQVRDRLGKGSVVVIDDIHWWDSALHQSDPRCYQAWQRIAQDSRVCCAVELNQSIGMALIS